VYKTHENFITPPLDAVLWRYVDFTKFVSLLEKEALFFSNVANFSDPFEGTYPTGNLNMVPEEDRSRVQAFSKSVEDILFVNCWHLSKFESAAMWRIYSAWDRGIAIKSTVDGLSKSLICDANVYVGAVSYIDYGTEETEWGNAFVPYLTKRKSFEYEQEVRAITMNAVPHDTERLGTSAEWTGTGIYFQVELDLLIEEVLVAPQAEDWFVDLVQSVVKRYGLKAHVTRSGLASSPPYLVPRSQTIPALLDKLSQVLGEDFELITSSDAKVSRRAHQGQGVNYDNVESYFRLNYGEPEAGTEA